MRSKILSLVLITSFIAGCSSYKPKFAKKGEFSAPAGWSYKKRNSKGVKSICYNSPRDPKTNASKFAIQFDLLGSKQYPNIEKYSKDILEELLKGKTFVWVKKTGTTTVDGLPCTKFAGEISASDIDKRVVFMGRLIKDGPRFYYVTGYCKKQDEEQFKPIFEKFVHSLK